MNEKNCSYRIDFYEDNYKVGIEMDYSTRNKYEVMEILKDNFRRTVGAVDNFGVEKYRKCFDENEYNLSQHGDILNDEYCNFFEPVFHIVSSSHSKSEGNVTKYIAYVVDIRKIKTEE